ncbi:uncharacterized protein [Littorina saxatilis]|uniref:Uncharacterized protein n=1 Tax=Littorina saxatilis TaxID=31220 RepID=A0AAN9GBX2_9CAEN
MGLRQSATVPATTSEYSEASRSSRNEQLRREFDNLFADMEFRSKRSALMNYHEAERYDNRSHMVQMISTVVGALGVSGIAASVAKTKQVAANSAGVAGVLALPLCAILQFFSNGSTTLAPTLAEKAKVHTEAGAGWQRIARLSRVYRLQLKLLPDDELNSGVLTAWYREVVEATEEVSKLMPIRADTYIKFEQPETVKVRLDKRENLLKKYKDLEVNGPGRE